MTPQELFRCVVGISKGYEWSTGEIRDILFQGPDSSFPTEHVRYYQQIGDIVCSLYGAYDFTRSPKFLASIGGKSHEFSRMKLKMETAPAKRRLQEQEFLAALERLPESLEVYELLDSAQHTHLDRIVEALREIERQPASPRNLPSQSQKQELDSLLDDALRMALQLVAKHGSHIPFALIVTPTGRRVNLAADNSEVHDGEVLYATVREELLKMIQQNGVRAFALAHDVEYKKADTGESTDAVQVALEHFNGMSVTCYLPYRLVEANPIPGELFATDSQEKLFS